MVTNPGTRDWTLTASLFATLNDMFGERTVCGIGRGDSALRVIGRRPCSLATLAEAMEVIKGRAEGREVTCRGQPQKIPLRPARAPGLVPGTCPKLWGPGGDVNPTWRRVRDVVPCTDVKVGLLLRGADLAEKLLLHLLCGLFRACALVHEVPVQCTDFPSPRQSSCDVRRATLKDFRGGGFFPATISSRSPGSPR